MADQEKAVPQEEFQVLRSRLESDFRRKIFGGIDQQDVIKYVQSIREQSQEVHEVYELRLNELQESNKNLRRDLETVCRELQDKNELADELQRSVSLLEAERKNHLTEVEEVVRLKAENVSLTSDQEEILNRLAELEETTIHLKSDLTEKNDDCQKLTEQLSNIQDEALEEKLRDYREKLDDSQRQMEILSRERAGLEQILQVEQNKTDMMFAENSDLKVQLSEIRDKIEIVKSHVDFLEDQVKGKSVLEQQLERERMRANKAEKDMAMLSEWVAKLKDRFQNNQGYFDIRLKELEEKQYDNNRKYVADILREASQNAENILVSAQSNAEAIIDGANRRIQEITASYGVFQSDVMGFRNNLQDFQLKAGAEMEVLYSAIKKPPVDLADDDKQADKKTNIVQFSKIG